MARSLHLLVVGKIKESNLKDIENEYLKRIQSPALQIHEVKSQAENKKIEGDEILKKIHEWQKEGPCYIVCLTEKGKDYDSLKFADWITQLIEKGQGKCIFIISGAEGFDQRVLDLCDIQWSLSKLTFPHKIARILAVEQLYRAQTIRLNHPYHN